MVKKKIAVLVVFAFLMSSIVIAADLELEDINFPFNSSVVVDDLKQIPRLVEYLQADPELLVEIEAHTDSIGSRKFNEELSRKRALSVKDLLTRQGLSNDRIQILTYGKDKPKERTPTREGHFINRRVVFNIYKIVDGRKDYYYKDNEFIKLNETALSRADRPAADRTAPRDRDHLDESRESFAGNNGADGALTDIMKRLERIESALEKKGEQPTQERVITQPYLSQVQPDRSEAPKIFTQEDEVRRISTGSNIGSISFGGGTERGHFAGSVDGRLFIPIDRAFALQGGLRGTISDKVQEYQIDAGIIGKHERIQLGAFGSTKFARLKDFGETGNLSQMSVVASYLFEHGSIGAFATKAIKSEDVISAEQHYEFSDLFTTETYLKLRDKYGISFDYLFGNGISVEGDLGIVKADNADTGGKLKVGYPIGTNDNLRMFVQGSYNTGLIKSDNNYAALIGLEIGRWTKSKGITMAEDIRPMQVPDITYELKQRTSVLKSGVNLLPVVSISASPVSGEAPLAVVFTGIANDPDGTIASLIWNFGDGTEGSGESETHTYTENGTYLVTLTAQDDKGGKASANIQITVGPKVNLLPVVSISASAVSGDAPLTVSFIASAADPDGKIVHLAWNFGDGSVGEGQNVTHTFNRGIYLVTLTATDDQGGKASASIQIMAGNILDPVADAGPDRDIKLLLYPINISPVLLDGSNSYDPHGLPLFYEWSQIAGPQVQINNPNSAKATFRLAGFAADYVFQLRVSNGRGSDISQVRITATP
jgi:PKD repeat protein